MFVQSAKFKDAHQKKLGKKGDLAIHGQELMASTRRLCLIVDADVKLTHRADWILTRGYDALSVVVGV
jgi:hypothetical protein